NIWFRAVISLASHSTCSLGRRRQRGPSLPLCCGDIVSVNVPISIHIEPVVCAVHYLARVTLHRRDIISIDPPGPINVAKEDTYGHRGGGVNLPEVVMHTI